MKKVIAVLAVVIVLVTGILLGLWVSRGEQKNREKTPDMTVSKEEADYREAKDHLEQGNYVQAYQILNHLADYKDSQEIRQQMVYESYVFSGIHSLKEQMDLGQNLKVSEVTFYAKGKTYPVILLKYSTESSQHEEYAYFQYGKKKKQYVLVDVVPTLDMDQLDRYNKEYVSDTLSILEIEQYQEKWKTVGQVDIERINRVLVNQTDSNVTILEP